MKLLIQLRNYVYNKVLPVIFPPSILLLFPEFIQDDKDQTSNSQLPKKIR